MKITVIGTGYVGLVSGAVFADWGHDVVCLDVDESKIQNIKNGVMPIYEEGLQELVNKVQNVEKRFLATTDYKMAVEHGELLFICVGTPGNQSGAADLSYVFQVSESIGKFMNSTDYKVIITKSTVPVGTHNKVKEYIKKGAGDKKIEFSVASNPEFLREGTSIYDANNTDRVVIGSDSNKALDMLENLYKHLNAPIVKTDLASAELIKYAANAFLATKISFINEISQICERTGADVVSVAQGMGLDKRIGSKFLNAGIGYGGSCFPKDVEALYRTSSENFYDFRLLRGVMDANERQKYYFIEKIFSKYNSNLSGLTFGVLGAAFKNGTDDVRKSVALEVIKLLRGSGAQIKLYDPAAMDTAKGALGNEYIEYAKQANDVFIGSDAIVILTEWPEFVSLNYESLVGKLKSKVIFDGRNLLDPEGMKEMGVEYYPIGRHNAI
ncbi:UDP-glucose 6-dehydrogenase [candidate division WWE3 bacterium CG10_big_fil_rev_8_21_14_0_10_32_10]|uniref:UDP-glucose 6-dehydrogenase n=1 Tax=candidate division WWE3 bacterium CG10_big_fil_rev_8_21_14_0_10_32_10 TaxID=1975090 RepID=A0A2H0RAK4_UNCKA|nr:MAG: UDP-glucose 6-dehydrogenase [candidate division WWE3 bacterium CG10_big_fil_rev_8_21_14_0_10_32_10]